MNEQVYLTFENYLNNEMSANERLEFENQLQNDADMQDKFQIYKEMNQFLSVKFDPETEDFKKSLGTISKEHFTENKTKTKVIAFTPWYYAAAASVVIALGVWFVNQGNPEYGDYNQHENAYFTERSVGDKNLNDAQKAFNEKDYNKAIISFEKVTDLTNPELQYFFAIALIETNHFRNAEIYLKNIKSGTSVYKDKAIWYLALSYLKQKKFDECKTYLKQIPRDAEDYAKAQELLKNLD